MTTVCARKGTGFAARNLYPFSSNVMIRANHKDKELIVDILAKSFDENKSVNYIVKQDSNRSARLRKLMEYSFDVCHLFGDIFLSDDKKGCALIVMPDKKKTTLKSIGLDAKLVTSVIGLSNVKKAMSRESRINKLHPKTPFYYLWFIGVDPSQQSQGTGTTANLTLEIRRGDRYILCFCSLLSFSFGRRISLVNRIINELCTFN
jgi:hypothetical protein